MVDHIIKHIESRYAVVNNRLHRVYYQVRRDYTGAIIERIREISPHPVPTGHVSVLAQRWSIARVAWVLHHRAVPTARVYCRDRDYSNVSIDNLALAGTVERRSYRAQLWYRGMSVYLGTYSTDTQRRRAINEARTRIALGMPPRADWTRTHHEPRNNWSTVVVDKENH